jgi:succinyl-diaminopimelate desuccinylase
MSCYVTDTLDIACALMRCASVTPADAGALGILESVLSGSGFRTERLVFSDKDTPDIDNLYARFGTTAPYLLFAGHTDVVPPGNQAAWTHDPFGAEIADGMLFGRGAVDMKGAIAAFTAAAKRHISTHGLPVGSIGFLITGDEEGPAINGTAKVLDWMRGKGEVFDHAIVGEPSNVDAMGDTIKVGRRGSYSGIVTVHGKQGHVAYPHRANNPVPGLIKLADALTSVPLDQGTDVFDRSNLEIIALEAGAGAFNIIPGTAVLKFNVRFNDLWSRQSLEAELRARMDRTGQAYTLEVVRGGSEAFRIKPGAFLETVSAAITDVTGRTPTPSTGGGTSDARFIARDGPVLEFGLVGRTMHMVDENVPLDELEVLTRIYSRIIERYFAMSNAPST